MTTATKTRPEQSEPAPPAVATDDPFAAQLEGATLAPKQAKTLPEWEGPVPASVVALVARAVAENVRVTVPCTDPAVAYALRTAITTQVKREWPHLAAHVRDRLTDDKLTAVLFTVGAPSGRRVASS